MILSRGKTVAALVAMTLGLAGCVTLLPKVHPAQLYRFGRGEAEAPAAGPGRGVTLAGPTRFPMAVGGDRILTTRGLSAAYLAGAHWVAPASVLFDEAAVRAFAQAQPPAAPAPGLNLSLTVRSFEARYPGPGDVADGSPPTAMVVVEADLRRDGSEALVGSRVFESRRAASAHRVGPIVAAFDAATSDVLAQMEAWRPAEAVSPPPH